MLVEKLSMEKRIDFLKTLHVILMFDRLVLWEGKTEDEIDSDTDMSKVNFAEDTVKDTVYNKLFHLCKYRVYAHSNELIDHGGVFLSDVKNDNLHRFLIENVCKLPIFKQNKISNRMDIAKKFIAEYKDASDDGCDFFVNMYADDNNLNLDGPETYKIFLCQLIKACVKAECLTQERLEILKYICEIKSIDLVYFDEILEHVMLAQKAKQKLVDIILE